MLLTNQKLFEVMARTGISMILRRFFLLASVLVMLGGCTTDDLRQAAIIGGGGAGGAAIGNALGHDKKNQALYAAGGGAAGAAVGAIVAGPNKSYGERRYQEGYDQAQSNDVKSLYWMKVDLERGNQYQGGRQVYYGLPSQDVAPDGTKYVPHKVVVPIVE
jgi:hypothetical protein